MKDPDYEGMVRDLNTLLAWARMRINHENGQGQFSFNVSWRKLETKRSATYLKGILKDLGYVERVGGNNKYPIWWVKPEGQVTIEEYTKYKVGQQLAKSALRDPDDVHMELIKARAEIERLRRELRGLKTTITKALK